MAGNAYPHIVFAKDPEVLPMQTLTEVLGELYPEAQVHQGAIKAVLQLGSYAFTFWYDEEADGLGSRYADYAAPLRRKRVERCSVMIDASGDVDEDGSHASDAARIMGALAQRDGVYVFSEESKRFLGMDYEDGGDLGTATVAGDPAVDPQAPVSPPAHAGAGEREVVLGSEEVSGDIPHTESRPVDHLPEQPAQTERHDRFTAPTGAATYTSTADSRIEGSRADEPRTEQVEVSPSTASGVPAEVLGDTPPVVVPAQDSTRVEEPIRIEETHVETTRVEQTPVTHDVSPTPSTGGTPAAATSAPAAGAPVQPEHPETAHSQGRPATDERQEKPGLLKRLFGRKR